MNISREFQRTMAVPRRDVNALKCTGPRTSEGKAVSSRNALKHGLTATQVVIPGENQADFDQLLADLTADRKPEGELEIQLVGEIAACTWRLARARSREGQLLEIQGDLFFSDRNPGFERLLRYMGAIERQLNRATVRLQQLQAERRKQAKTEEKPKTMAAGGAGSTTSTVLEFVSSNAPQPPVDAIVAVPQPVAAVRELVIHDRS